MQELDRRKMMAAVGGMATATATGSLMSGRRASAREDQALSGDSVSVSRSSSPSGKSAEVVYCINTSTIRGQKLGLEAEVELAAKTGYGGIEPWIREIVDFQNQGGNLKDLKKKIVDLGMTVESSIGFANWIVDDEVKRKAALEQARREMDLVAQIGGTHIAAPPAGATNQSDLDLFKAAERYRDLVKVGESIGVLPQVEVWGFSQSLNRLGECVFVAVESGCANACVLPDVYHIYKGGSGFEGLSLLAGRMIQCFHLNDYPASPSRDKIGDADRVYPGDGVAPIAQILKWVFANGFNGALSLELFNKDYWKQDPEKVLRTGLEKMKSVVAKAIDE